jgi:chromosome segregation ATPase
MNVTEALIELRKGLRVYKAFEHAEELAQAVGGLEQNQRELQAAIDKLRDDLEAAKASHAKTLAQLVAERQAAEEAALKAQDAAKVAGKATIEASERRVAAHSKKLAELELDAQARRDAALAEAAKAEARRDAAAKELDELTTKIETARAQIAKLLG